MARVLLGVTGSVAAIRTPDLVAAFRAAGHEVKVVATQASLYFFDPAAIDPLDPARPARNPDVVTLDEDEWPGRSAGQRYRRGDAVRHIELRRWAEVFAIAPLDANTLAKLANGICDNCLTCVWRAWDRNRPVVLAPAMNTLMWENALTARHLRQIAPTMIPENLTPAEAIDWINLNDERLRIVSPQSKELACGDVGMGALAPLEEIVRVVGDMASGGR